MNRYLLPFVTEVGRHIGGAIQHSEKITAPALRRLGAQVVQRHYAGHFFGGGTGA